MSLLPGVRKSTPSSAWFLWLGGGLLLVGAVIVLLSPLLDLMDRQREMEALHLRTPYLRSPIYGILGWALRGGVTALCGFALILLGVRRGQHIGRWRDDAAQGPWSG